MPTIHEVSVCGVEGPYELNNCDSDPVIIRQCMNRVGVLRLRVGIASRNRHYAQDNKEL
jgi:hypothetical protein